MSTASPNDAPQHNLQCAEEYKKGGAGPPHDANRTREYYALLNGVSPLRAPVQALPEPAYMTLFPGPLAPIKELITNKSLSVVTD